MGGHGSETVASIASSGLKCNRLGLGNDLHKPLSDGDELLFFQLVAADKTQLTLAYTSWRLFGVDAVWQSTHRTVVR